MAYWFRYQATYLEMKYHLKQVLKGKEEYYIKPIRYYDRNIGKSAALARLSAKYDIPIVVPDHNWQRYLERNITCYIPKYFKKKPKIIVVSDYLKGQRHKILLMEEKINYRQIEQINNMCQGTIVGYKNYD